jgi:ABC-type sugar transport system ATPase subunit
VYELCDRVHVLLHGRIAGVLPKKDAAPEELVRWITGVAVESGQDIPVEVAEAELRPDE